jgi:diadenosine tetraphosphatase ApaH/serine/threonine PP2A family protein phosphatase
VDEVRTGDEVEIQSVDGVAAADMESGFSIGPSVAAAARGERLDGYDESLGLSPFLPGARYARTLISLTGDVLRLRVLDGAPLTQRFQGVSCSEAARLVEADGLDPEAVYHLDGGQSAKLAFRRGGEQVVLGSMHYLLWPKQDEGAFHWRGREGRLLRSALTVRARG